MRLLLDTHVFLWFLSDDRRLPASSRQAIESAESEVFLSVASIWEVVVKHQLGKLPLAEPPATLLPREAIKNSVGILPIEEGSMGPLADLPLLHRDPFDRLLVAQALQHDLTLVTSDTALSAYEVAILPED